ncbi:hypothetical protein GVAV_001076 [Gurleya vavrai]
MIMFGTEPQLPNENIYNKKPIISNLSQERTKRDLHFDQYSKNEIEKGKIRDNRVFKIGDKVMIHNQIGKGKIEQHWFKGYQIEKKTNESSYDVKKNGKKIRVNKESIKQQNFFLK